MKAPRIVSAENDLLYDSDGRSYIDLFSAHGSAWLGHRPPAVEARLRDQLARVWLVGKLPTPAFEEAQAKLTALFPAGHALSAVYSTGMEAVEFALRFARVATGRREVIGFAHAMHGKSLAAASLGWDEPDGVALPGVKRLPFPVPGAEREVLTALADALAPRRVSAVFVEPIQASAGGHAAPPSFLAGLHRLCRDSGTLLVFDEILTGLHRTGPRFVFSELGFVPDVVLLGKALGSGFPVATVVSDTRHPIVPAMLPWSTFAGNPLAATAVAATLDAFAAIDLPARVAAIERVVRHAVEPLAGSGVEVRGRGALWVVELPPGADVEGIVTRAFERGVALGFNGRQIRVLPAATIDEERLARAAAVVVDGCLEACAERRPA